VAFGGETEFFEEDHGAGVGLHGERFDFCGGGEEEEEGNVGFPHCDFGTVVKISISEFGMAVEKGTPLIRKMVITHEA
jgi:hypothetical protein